MVTSEGARKVRVRRRKGYSHPPEKSTCLIVSVPRPRPRGNWETLCASAKMADLGRWSYISTADEDTITLCKFTASTPPTVYMTINISSPTPTCHSNWNLLVGRTHLSVEQVSNLPGTIHSMSDLYTMLNGIDKCNFCIGCSDKKFTPLIELHNGNFCDQYGECPFSLTWLLASWVHVLIILGEKVAYFDEVHYTIRHVQCSLLLEGSLCCNHCKKYQKNTLNRLLYRLNNKSAQDKENTNSHINHRFMSSESKNLRIKALKSELQKKTKALKRIESILQEHIRNEYVPVDDALHADLKAIMDKHVNLEDDDNEPGMNFSKIFWRQQCQAFSKKCAKSVRWHPLVVKWCLYLHHKSSGAYETLRNSGLIRLPSGRTLRDYRYIYFLKTKKKAYTVVRWHT